MTTANLEYESGLDEYFVVLPQEIVDEWGLEEGDELEWVIEEDKVYLTRK